MRQRRTNQGVERHGHLHVQVKRAWAGYSWHGSITTTTITSSPARSGAQCVLCCFLSTRFSSVCLLGDEQGHCSQTLVHELVKREIRVHIHLNVRAYKFDMYQPQKIIKVINFCTRKCTSFQDALVILVCTQHWLNSTFVGQWKITDHCGNTLAEVCSDGVLSSSLIY